MVSRSSAIVLLSLLIVSATGGSFLTACTDHDDTLRSVPNQGDPYESPTMTTTDVDSWVSDSGYVKYHIIAPIWDMYEDLAEPFWKFPEGLHIETFNPDRTIKGEIHSDSATYFHQRRLAKLQGHVLAVNTNRDTFLTSLIYWDQDKSKFYTDSFIHIVKTDRIIEGYGFSANEQMTEYAIHRPTAILPASSIRGDKRPEPVGPIDTTQIERPEVLDPDIRVRTAPSPASVRNQSRDEIKSAKREMSGAASSVTAQPILKR